MCYFTWKLEFFSNIFFRACSYIGKTSRNFKSRTEEHIKKDNKSHIFKHLHSSLKIKEALHIIWRKPNLNPQQKHLCLTLSLLYSVFVAVFFFLFFFISVSSITFLISNTNNRLLLLFFSLFAITSSNYNTLCISFFSFIYYFHYLYANYWHFLLS